MKNYWVLVFVLSLGFVIGTFIKLLDTDIKDSWILIIGFILVFWGFYKYIDTNYVKKTDIKTDDENMV